MPHVASSCRAALATDALAARPSRFDDRLQRTDRQALAEQRRAAPWRLRRLVTFRGLLGVRRRRRRPEGMRQNSTSLRESRDRPESAPPHQRDDAPHAPPSPDHVQAASAYLAAAPKRASESLPTRTRAAAGAGGRAPARATSAPDAARSPHRRPRPSRRPRSSRSMSLRPRARTGPRSRGSSRRRSPALA
jgi:hypothetical protein